MKRIKAALLAGIIMVTATGCSLEELGLRTRGEEATTEASSEVSVEKKETEPVGKAAVETTTEDLATRYYKDPTSLSPEELFELFCQGEIKASILSENGEGDSYIDASNYEFENYTDATSAVSIEESLDLDNDGEVEFVLKNMVYGDMYFDCKDGAVVCFAWGEGTAIQCSNQFIDGEYWVVHGGFVGEDSSYTFEKYNGDLEVTDSFRISCLNQDGVKKYYKDDSEISGQLYSAYLNVEFDGTESYEETVPCEEVELSLSEQPSWAKIGIAPSAGMSFASFEIDLDKDGVTEAFVLEGYHDEPLREDYDESHEYWYASRIWSVDESGVAKEIFDLDQTHIATKQKVLASDNGAFIALNGYWSREPVGLVFGLTDNALTDAAPDTWRQGQKLFTKEGELLWNLECYCGFAPYKKGSTAMETGFSGRNILPYYLHLVDGVFRNYGAKEISLEEAKAMADLKLGGIADTESVQVILRDNNQLDINYVDRSEYDYTFYFNRYHLSEDQKSWEFDYSNFGFLNVVPGEDNTWSVLSETM